MNLAACRGLPRTPENRVWFRLIDLTHLGTALGSAHSKKKAARFNPGPLLAAPNQFAILSLADDPIVGQFEAEAVLGNHRVWQAVSGLSLVTLNVHVILSDVIDLTDVATAQTPLDMTAQELTGDWEGYDIRAMRGVPLSSPTGIAPTQALGMSLFATGVEGFRSISAKLPHHKTLFVFPDNLKAGSSLTFTDPAGSVVHRIP